MSERPRKSNRAGTFRSEPPLEGVPRESINSSPFSSPRGSPSPIEPTTTRDSEHAHQVVDQETKNLSQTIRELIQGVPAAPASSPIHRNPSAPEGRTGGFLPSFEDVTESKSSSGNDVLAPTTEPPHPAQDRSALSMQRETDSLATPGHGSSGEPRADRPGELLEEKTGPTETAGNLPPGSESVPALIGSLAGSVDTSHDRNFTPASTGVGNDISRTSLAASVPLVDSHMTPGDVGGVASRDARMEESGNSIAARGESSMERMTVPASGLLGRGEDPFESASASSNSSDSMGSQIGGDSFSSHDGVGAGPDDSRAGVDMTRTNTLLEQILDALRRHEQPSYVQSGRSVYPER
jgi:hypothetical protein